MVHNIHIADSGDLSGYKTEIENGYNSGLYSLRYIKNHLGREFNQRCDSEAANHLMLPHSGDFRPYDYAATLLSDLVLINGDDLLLKDGGDLILI